MDSGVAIPGGSPTFILGDFDALSTQSRFCCAFTFFFFHLMSSVPTKPSVFHCRGSLDTDSPSPVGEAGGRKASCRRGHLRVFHFVFRPPGKMPPAVYH